MSNPVTGTVQSPSASSSSAAIVIRKISVADLKDALRLGWEDFKAVPSHGVMLALIYPVLGLVLARATLGYSILPLLFPLAAGFALLGPFAALGFYDLSRRRENGEDATASHALSVLSSPSIGAMLGLGGALLVLFLVWLTAAQSIYSSLFGYAPASSIPNFLSEVLTTSKGHSLIFIGCSVGFLFALAAFCISVVSFPMMLDRHSSAADAVLTSLRAVAKNPVQMAIWGLIVAALLVIGTVPFFLGLTVVIPVLGHATWHLYRKVVEPPATPYVPPPKPKLHRYAAEFPVSLFTLGRREH
ncbi:putative membrane protein [Nitrobacteraceae bacterium AZCC 1564]